VESTIQRGGTDHDSERIATALPGLEVTFAVT